MNKENDFSGVEAKNNKTSGRMVNILGVKIASIDLSEVLEVLKEKINNRSLNRPYFVVTAYSETLLEAADNPEFKKVLERADLIVPDGVSLWAAADYLNGKNVIEAGWKVISGQYKNRPAGVKMFEVFLRNPGYKKLLFGGFGGVAERLGKAFGCEASEDEAGIIELVNKSRPDILFVALGRVKQEMWIARNLKQLKCKVVMGVGSAFDEVAGEGMWAAPVPAWVDGMGLKWLWRAVHDKKHWPRAWRAVVVFPWRVFRYVRN